MVQIGTVQIQAIRKVIRLNQNFPASTAVKEGILQSTAVIIKVKLMRLKRNPTIRSQLDVRFASQYKTNLDDCDSSNRNYWYLHSAATVHRTNNEDDFVTCEELSEPAVITVANNGGKMYGTKIRTIVVKSDLGFIIKL